MNHQSPYPATPNIYLYTLSVLRILLPKFCVYSINLTTAAKAETGIKEINIRFPCSCMFFDFLKFNIFAAENHCLLYFYNYNRLYVCVQMNLDIDF